MLALGYNFWTEWELQEKVDFDGINKLIIVYPHVTTLDIREDVWSAWVRWHDMQDRGYDRFLLAMDRSGLETIPNGQTGDYYFLKNGWKLLVDLSKVAITGVLYSRDYASPYFTPDEVVQFPAQVSSVVNTVIQVENIVTGDLASVPTVDDILSADPTGYPKGSVGDRIDKTSNIDKAIFIDTDALINGDGTSGSPYNNLADTLDDAESNGFKKIIVYSDITIDRNLKNFTIIGVGDPYVDLNGQNVDKSVFIDVHLTGTGSGKIVTKDCILEDGLSGVYGRFMGAGLDGNFYPSGNCKFIKCHSGIAGFLRPHIYYPVGLAISVSVRDWSGGLTIHNMDQVNDKLTIESGHSKIELDASCANGEASLRGTHFFDDNSNGTNVDTEGNVDPRDIQHIKDILEADEEYTSTTAIKKHKVTKAILVSKNVSGGSIPSPITISE